MSCVGIQSLTEMVGFWFHARMSTHSISDELKLEEGDEEEEKESDYTSINN